MNIEIDSLNKDMFKTDEDVLRLPPGGLGAAIGVIAGVGLTAMSKKSNIGTILGTAIIGSMIGTKVTAVTTVITALSFNPVSSVKVECSSAGVTLIGTAATGAILNTLLGNS